MLGKTLGAAGRLFVAKMPPCVSEEEFHKHFSAYGAVLDVYMPRDRTRQHYRGIGFVTYDSVDVAKAVVSTQHRFRGHLVIVDFATVKHDRKAKRSTRAEKMSSYSSSIKSSPAAGFIDGSSHAVTGEINSDFPRLIKSCRSMSSEFLSTLQHTLQASGVDDCQESIEGEQEDAKKQAVSMQAGVLPPPPLYTNMWAVPYMPEKQVLGEVQCLDALCPSESYLQALKLLGQLLVRPNDHHQHSIAPVATTDCTENATGQDDEHRCRETLHENQVNSVLCDAKTAEWTSEQRCKPRIYVGRLPDDCDESDLRELFTEYGGVTDVFMPKSRGNKHRHRGFGFVSFDGLEPIEKIIANGVHKIGDRPLALDIAIPEDFRISTI